jgi:hypothetical protein
MSYPKGTPLIADRRAGIINSAWSNEETAEKERLRLISERPRTVIYIRSRRVRGQRIKSD